MISAFVFVGILDLQMSFDQICSSGSLGCFGLSFFPDPCASGIVFSLRFAERIVVWREHEDRRV